MSIAIAAAAAIASAAAATASADPAFDQLESALPAGWSVLATSSELVIRHDRPCYVTGARGGSALGAQARPAVPAAGPLVTLELRYRLEPRWTAPQIAAAEASNRQLAAELRVLAAKYRIDAIRTSKGRPLPATADEKARLDAYEAAGARLAAREVKLPRCTLGESSVFDGEDTYAQLALQVDPPEAMTQAHRIVELMKRACR
jgi:hypothetical protein